MKQIITTMISIILMFAGVLTVTGIASTNVEYDKAKDFHADVINEIEASNFAPSVINACKTDAQKEGYELTINTTVIDAEINNQVAQVTLKYDYQIPFLKIDKEKSIRGYAR